VTHIVEPVVTRNAHLEINVQAGSANILVVLVLVIQFDSLVLDTARLCRLLLKG
jgi:hypothetical protein